MTDSAGFYSGKRGIVVLSIIFLVVLTFMITVGVSGLADKSDLIQKISLWIAVVIQIVVISLWLDQLFIRGPTLEISNAGIRDLRFSRHQIKWDEIESIVLWGLDDKLEPSFVVLYLRPGALRNFSRSWRRKIFDAVNHFFGDRGIYLSIIELNCSVDDILEAIDRVAPQRLVRPPGRRLAPASNNTPDLSDPTYWLHNPPMDATVTDFKGRRIVVLKDGRITAELLSGRARWFSSIEEFRAFIGE